MLFLSLIGYSQQIGEFIQASQDIRMPFTIVQFSTKDGLPQSTIIHIGTKANGNLLLNTANGIVEFNGNELTPVSQSPELKKLIFSQLFYQNNSETLFALRYDGMLYTVLPELAPVVKLSCCNLKNDTLIGITEKGDLMFNTGRSKAFIKLCNTGITKANSIIWHGSKIMIATNKQVVIFDLKTRKSFLINVPDVQKIKWNRFNSGIYVLGLKELFKLNKDKLESIFKIKDPLRDGVCLDFDFNNEFETIVGTTNGMYHVCDGYTDYYSKKSGLPSNYIQSVCYDDDGKCIYIGTGEKGLLKMQFKNCYSFSKSQGFCETSALSSIIRTCSGDVLISENCKDLRKGSVFKLGIDTVYDYLKINDTYCNLAEIDSLIFAGTASNGLKIFKGKVLIDSVKIPAVASNYIHCSFKDHSGRIWVGNEKGISCGKSFKELKPFHPDKYNKPVICVYELRDKRICIGMYNGFIIVDVKGNIINEFNSSNGFVGKEVRSFYEDKEGKIWIGTYNGGIYCLKGGVLKSINKIKNCMLNYDAFCLASDRNGYIYITSNNGLWKVREKDLDDFYYGKLNYLIPFYYNEENGILNTEFNGGFQNNFLKTKMDHFYFPTLEGIVILVPDEPVFKKLQPKFNKILANDTVCHLTNNKFDRSTYSIEFDITCNNISNKNNVYYQFKLQKNEEESSWSTLSKSGKISFKLLSPGDYKLTVVALDAFNDREPRELTYTFSILPYFYETTLFKVIVLLAVLVVLVLILRNRFKRIKKKAEEKELIKRQLAEIELKAIQSQMNPHFVFNSLNSIKYYLSINDQEKADKYIDHFSRLLRDFLECASLDFITISKEVQIIESYLELEKQRVNPPFDYEIILEESLKNCLIPTYMLQPLIENAIKHGINNSSKKCELKLSFSKKEDKLVCIIQDNGIGMSRSKQINKTRNGHVSKGLSIVHNKLEIIEKKYGISISIDFEDLEPSISETGTLVRITLPLMYDRNSNN